MRLLPWPISVAAVLALISGCTSSASNPPANPSGVAPISQVVRPEQVKEECCPIDVSGRWKVRLGLIDPEPPGGAWRLLLCWAEYTGADGDPVVMDSGGVESGEYAMRVPLGPVRVEVTDPDVQPTDRLKYLADKVRMAFGCEAMLTMVVPTAWKGRYQISVYDAEGREIARTVLAASEPGPCWWQELLRFDASSPPGETRWTMAAHGQAVLPSVEKYMPASLSKSGERLKMTLEDRRLVIRCEDSLLDDPGSRLAVRWWVNGRPVPVPPIKGGPELHKTADASDPAVVRAPLRLPPLLGELKVGDEVGLQVMHSPGRLQFVSADRHSLMMEEDLLERLRASKAAPNMPVLSNRLDLKVEPWMLEGREGEE